MESKDVEAAFMTLAPSGERRRDFALVVGVNDYPAFRRLEGPINDAKAFVSWLRDPDGGGVKEEDLQVVTSTPAPTPEQKHVDAALQTLLDAADLVGGGRRLYFYFSGHGAAATDAVENVALLLADWSKKYARLGLSSKSYANDLVGFGLFEELVVFLDCCRADGVAIVGRDCSLTPELKTRRTTTRTLVAYATEAHRSAFERRDSGTWSGEFTKRLLAILKRADAGLLATDLKDQLELEVSEAKTGQQAHVVNGLHGDSRFGRVGTVSRLRVTFAATTTGAVQLRDGFGEIVAVHDPADGLWEIPLTEGRLYKLIHLSTGRKRMIDFTESVDVQF